MHLSGEPLLRPAIVVELGFERGDKKWPEKHERDKLCIEFYDVQRYEMQIKPFSTVFYFRDLFEIGFELKKSFQEP